MNPKEHSGQEFSVAQSDESSDGCPICGGPIQSVTRRSPGEVVVEPCGHNVSDTLARNFPRVDERAVTDGGSDVGCEMAEVDEHCGPVQIVLDDEDTPLAMCWECRKKFGYKRVVDEDPGPARTDGGVEAADPAPESIDWDTLGYVAASDYRCAVVAALDVGGPATPTKIGERAGLAVTHVSRTLTELRERDVVELLVPEERKRGRFYGLTDKGQALADETDEVAG